jgi:hypothetical protein
MTVRTFSRLSRRNALVGLAAAWPAVAWPTKAWGFGQEGAFNPRPLGTSGTRPLSATRSSGLSQWSWELIRRTSAPARLHPDGVAADEAELSNEPFCVWASDAAIEPLTGAEQRGLREFFELGGVMFVDDAAPESGEFGRSVRSELAKVLPEVPLIPLPAKHVIYKSYYLVERPVGRVQGPTTLEGLVRGQKLQVILSSHDLLGALARDDGGTYAFPVEGDAEVRQRAVRLAVNIAMYVLCSDYKDDQVHAEELMRRRGRPDAR